MHENRAPTTSIVDIPAIRNGVEKLGPWFHRLELPGGILTKTESHFGEHPDHPLPTWEKVRQALPEDLTGKRVLDVGCNAGFYSFQAAERGAESVLGLEAVRWTVQQARFAAQALGLENVRFDRGSIYDLDPLHHGSYDVVLALGLAYHLKHLVSGLERLFTVTDDLLIIESAVVPLDAVGSAGEGPFSYADEELFVLAYSRNSPWVKESAFNWFFPTPSSLKAMLQDVGFVDVRVVDTFFNRCLISARKPAGKIDSRYPAYLRAKFQTPQELLVAGPNQDVELSLTVRNTGSAVWLANGGENSRGKVALTGKLFSEEDPVFGQQLPAVPMPADVAPGEEWSPVLRFQAPAAPGLYTLELDMVSEHVAYFQDVGSAPLERALEVRG